MNNLFPLQVKERSILMLLLAPNDTPNIQKSSKAKSGSYFLTNKAEKDAAKQANNVYTDDSYVILESLELQNVNSISIDMIANVAVANTIHSALIYPWHFTTVTISMSGKSYIGAFGEDMFGQSDNPNRTDPSSTTTSTWGNIKNVASRVSLSYRDYEVDDLFNNILNKSIGFQSVVSDMTSNKHPIRLLIKNNPPGLNDFIGHCTKFSFKESDSAPFVFNYDIDIVAKPWDAVQGQNAKARAIKGVI